MCSPNAIAQKPTKLPVIGYLSSVSPGPSASYVAAFHQGLGERGWVEGQNVLIEYRWAEGDNDRLPTLAADLIARKVDVIAATGGFRSARAAKDATTTIPIVFSSGRPVELGLVASLARPGANVTGISNFTGELMPKRFELLCELVPQARVIAWLANPNSSTHENDVKELREAAHVKGVELSVLKATNESEIDAAFASLVQHQAGALLMDAHPYFNSRREQLVALAARYAVPAMHEWRESVVAGGLISYGTSIPAVHRQVGVYVGRVLAGEKPADLPVQQPTRFELVINLRTAKAIGLTVSPSILDRADEVIE
jgi:putative ABC transport system substrate-binding protein